MADLTELVKEAQQDIDTADSLAELEQLRIKYLGKKGVVTSKLKQLKDLPPEERPQFGQQVNEAKQQISDKLEDHKNTLHQHALSKQLIQDTIDVTLPGRGQKAGGSHPITRTIERIEDYFQRLGFDMAQGPEIEDEYHNFEALNIPEHHPARAMHDTFYFDNGMLLRTHTSPVQIRVMKSQQPPIRTIACGRVYRCDSDLTHTPMFHLIQKPVLNILLNHTLRLGKH